jgi:hypothetical protein
MINLLQTLNLKDLRMHLTFFICLLWVFEINENINENLKTVKDDFIKVK